MCTGEPTAACPSARHTAIRQTAGMSDPDMLDADAVRRALATDLTIDIVMTGAKSGLPRTTEIWFMRIDGRLIICGTAGSITGGRGRHQRDWMANLKAHPEFVFRLKESIEAELPARAHVVTDAADRRHIMSHPSTQWYRDQGEPLELLVERSPIVEIELLDWAAGLWP